jgi:hypothetical protein
VVSPAARPPRLTDATVSAPKSCIACVASSVAALISSIASVGCISDAVARKIASSDAAASSFIASVTASFIDGSERVSASASALAPSM